MNARRLVASPLAIAVFAAVVSRAFAQDPADDTPSREPSLGSVVVGGAAPTLSRRSPDVLLLARPSVQQELKLTDAQRRKVARVDRARRERILIFAEVAEQGTLESVYSSIPESAIAQFAEVQAESEDEVDADVARVLDSRQRARLAQIGLQLEGPAAFDREDVHRALGLDEDQADAIRILLGEARRDLIRSSRVRVDVASPGFQEALALVRRAGDRVRDDATRKIVRVLSRGQIERLDRLKGEPFDAVGVVAGAIADRPEAPARGGLRGRRGPEPGDE